MKYIISKWDVFLAKHKFSELKSLANNAKIRSSLKFLLIRYIVVICCLLCVDPQTFFIDGMCQKISYNAYENINLLNWQII